MNLTKVRLLGATTTKQATDEVGAESDAAAVRRRAEAMEELAQIEINFAKLRDQLYIQRMRDNERDREEIEKGESQRGQATRFKS